MSIFDDQVADPTGWYHHCGRVDPGPSPGDSPDFASLLGESMPRARRAVLLSRVVTTEILPRLALAKRFVATRPGDADVTTEADTDEMVHLLLNRDAPEAIGLIERLQRRGATPESLYTGLLSAAARRLGALWEDDRCDFTQVTIGVGRLQQVARFLSPAFQHTAVSRPDPYSVLLMPAQGEQHTFGLLVLAEFFRRAGWHVAGGPVSAGLDPAELVRESHYDVAGFSIGSEALLSGLGKTIRRVRQVSCNRDIRIMVGGPLFMVRPELVARVGADTAATDAAGAVRQDSGLLATRAKAV